MVKINKNKTQLGILFLLLIALSLFISGCVNAPKADVTLKLKEDTIQSGETTDLIIVVANLYEEQISGKIVTSSRNDEISFDYPEDLLSITLQPGEETTKVIPVSGTVDTLESTYGINVAFQGDDEKYAAESIALTIEDGN